ncbi:MULTISPECIES: RNA polymerase sigma-70 factor [Mucilaginibacter]|nr:MULTISPECIES: RNA polymerase sigma-70 factor [Mucilaginibacter]QTE37610.2 RNA polymerase sigma-70 factor [Mucilaginibacter gossypii]
MYLKLDDQQLLRLLINGSEDAFAAIYNRYWRKLVAIGYSHTKDRFLAEEIVQEVFLSIWNRRNELKIDTVSSYLATAIKFSIFKHIATNNRRQRILSAMPNASLVEMTDELVHARFLKEYISGVVEEMPEKCRLVYKLSREEGLNVGEISQKMNIAEKTVEAHLSKALKVLRLNLKEFMVLAIFLHKI